MAPILTFPSGAPLPRRDPVTRDCPSGERCPPLLDAEGRYWDRCAMADQLTRRSFLGAGLTLGGAAALGRTPGLSSAQGHLIEKAYAASGAASLGDIEHVVIL